MDYKEWTRHGKCRDVRIIKIIQQSGNHSGRNGIDFVGGDQSEEGSHPSHDASRLDPEIECCQEHCPPASHRETCTGDTIRVNFGAGLQVVHGANVVPGLYTAPSESRVENIAKDDCFRVSGALIDLLDRFLRFDLGSLIRVV